MHLGVEVRMASHCGTLTLRIDQGLPPVSHIDY